MEEFFPRFATIFIIIWLILLCAILVEICFYRHKLIDTYLRLSDDRLNRIIRGNEKVVKIYRLMLWLSPVYLVFVPLAIYYVLPEWTVYYTIIVFLLFVTALVEYFYVRWILEQLSPRMEHTP
jgi:hypothetical protein